MSYKSDPLTLQLSVEITCGSNLKIIGIIVRFTPAILTKNSLAANLILSK